MSDNYQAVYDAVRSRISGGNIGDAVRAAISNANLSHYAEMAMRAAQQCAWDHSTPSAVYRPRVFLDGSHWCALYGDDIQSGVCGFGESPALACMDFDKNWDSKVVTKIAAEEKREAARAESQFGVGA